MHILYDSFVFLVSILKTDRRTKNLFLSSAYFLDFPLPTFSSISLEFSIHLVLVLVFLALEFSFLNRETTTVAVIIVKLDGCP